MKTKFLLLASMGALFLAGCQTAPSVKPGEESLVLQDVIEGFEDATVRLEVGSRYTPDKTEFSSTSGNVYRLNDNLYITAVDSEGNDVRITDGCFNVSSLKGYTVYYRVYSGRAYKERKVTVEVYDDTQPNITITGWRKERPVGTIPVPSIHVTDNSGETIEPTYQILDSAGKTTSGATIDEGYVTFTVPGEYQFTVKAKDSSGHEATQIQKITITEKLPEGVWEDFANENHMEVIRKTNHYTSQTQVAFHETFQGANGVVEIRPNYQERWFHSSFVQLGLAQTEEELYSCKWDSMILRMYVDAGSETSKVDIGNGPSAFTNIPTGSWQDVVIARKDYLSPSNYNAFPHMDDDTPKEERYAMFARALSGDDPELSFSVNTTTANRNVAIYLDSITWAKSSGEDQAPTVTLQGASWRVASHTTMTLPTIVVSDDLDPITTYDAIRFYSCNDDGSAKEELPIKNGTVAIGDAGKYKLVVSVSDFSGNRADREFFFTAVDNLDIHTIATYDAKEEVGGVNGEKSYLESFQGATGVMKTVVPAASTEVAGGLAFQFPNEIISLAISHRFDYIRLRVYVECETSSSVLGFYSWNSHLGDIKVGQWNDFDITIKALSHMSFISYTNQYTRDQVYDQFMHKYVYNMGDMMYTNDPELRSGKKDVTFYIDSIVWGKTYDGDFIASVPGLKSSFDYGTEKSIPVPTKAKVSDGITEREVAISSIRFEKYVKGTYEEILPVNEVLTFDGEGRYRATVQVTGTKGFTMEFVVEDLTGAIYTYSSDDVYEEAPQGVAYPVKGSKVQFNLHEGGSTWMDKFEGKDGNTEFGVQKANKPQGKLRFDIGNKPFEFDYIRVRVYFETALAEAVRIYTLRVPVCEGDGVLPANAWTDMIVRREMITDPNSMFYGGGVNNNSVDKFYEDVFGIPGYNNQNAFYFYLYKAGTADLLTDCTVYISLIAHGLDA